MNDKELMIALLAGKKITNQCWDNDMYVKLNEKGNLVDKDGKIADVYLHDTENWKEYVEYVDFNTAMQHIANGGRAKRKDWDYAIMLGFDGVFETIVWNKYDNDDEYTVKKQDILTKDWILL